MVFAAVFCSGSFASASSYISLHIRCCFRHIELFKHREWNIEKKDATPVTDAQVWRTSRVTF